MSARRQPGPESGARPDAAPTMRQTRPAAPPPTGRSSAGPYCELAALKGPPYFARGTDGGSVRHGVGFHFAPFGSFLKCVLRYSGPFRYAGSSRIDDTTSQTSPFGDGGSRS